MTVLIVDDAGIMRMILKDILVKFAGLNTKNIHEAADGMEAVQKYQEIKPDLVFLDIAMPDMDGITAVKKIINKDPSAKIIMCTSSSDQSDILDCIGAGAKDYIKKPPRPERVMQAYAKIVERPESTEQKDAQADANAARESDDKPNKPEKSALATLGESEISDLKKEVATLREEVAAIKKILKGANIV